jgi:hypothetical protein
MARRIDTDCELSAHTVIQVMIGRAQITANRDRLRVGVVCDLAVEQFMIVNLNDGDAGESECVRILEPGAPVRSVQIDGPEDVSAEIAPETEESFFC